VKATEACALPGVTVVIVGGWGATPTLKLKLFGPAPAAAVMVIAVAQYSSTSRKPSVGPPGVAGEPASWPSGDVQAKPTQ
jgi:hypothetical protein